MAQKRVFVLSTSAIAPAPIGAAVEHVCGHPGEILAVLADRGIEHVYLDGGITHPTLPGWGVPVLIGAGIPLFGPLLRDIRLQHVATRHVASGLVQSEYTVVA